MRKTEIQEKISKYLMESYDKLYRLAYSYMKNKEDKSKSYFYYEAHTETPLNFKDIVKENTVLTDMQEK